MWAAKMAFPWDLMNCIVLLLGGLIKQPLEAAQELPYKKIRRPLE
jgi:hypothetical protein